MKTRNSSKVEKPLERLFISELADMYSAEKQLAKALILLAKGAKSPDLKDLLETHQEETKCHAQSIEQIAESLGIKLPSKTCHAMTGLIKEGVVAMVKHVNSPVLDTALIAIGTKVEHYEIASYGTLCRWAKDLGHIHELAILVSILMQEKLANTLLIELSERTGPLKEAVRRVSQRRIREAAVL